jgi:glycine dehydrogenase subunit 1
MPYILNTPSDQQAMLAALGLESLEDLFAQIPPELRLRRPLNVPEAQGELALTQHMDSLARENGHAGSWTCFLGAGSYDHFIPAVVDAVASRGEFYTSYTPYQPEVSQGNLQATFEYQTLICQLTGMDVANASLYDGGSAVAEAALMCQSVTRRPRRMVVCDTVHPEYREVLRTYLRNLETEIVVVPSKEGCVEARDVAERVDEETSCVIAQNPNFFGCLEATDQIAEVAHRVGAKLVLAFDPISLGVLKRPAELGADVAVAEGQSLGSPMSYGGPYLGILACAKSFLRRLPGRLAGQTTDRRGRRCWVLTLQTREQHIRREKATSNICTNQGLYALRASVFLAALGPQGLRETAELCARKAHYAARRIAESARCQLAFDKPFFKEFVVRDTANQVDSLLTEARRRGVLAGVPLARWYPQLTDCFLVAVTEKRTREEIDLLANYLATTSLARTVHAKL